MTRADVLRAEAVAVGAVVLLVENRGRTGAALPADHRAIMAVQRDWPDSIGGDLMEVLIKSFACIFDRYGGAAALQRAALVVAREREVTR